MIVVNIQQALTGAEMNRVQYQNRAGSTTHSQKRRKYRINHPPGPNVVRHPIETNEKRNDLKKQMLNTAQNLDVATKNEVNRKGTIEVLRRPTIDAEQKTILCIKEITLPSQTEK